MNPQEWLPWLLVAQGVMGGFDTLLNHGLLVRRAAGLAAA